MQRTFTHLETRRDRIFQSIQVGAVQPNSDLLAELAELGDALADKPVKPVVVARMTVTRAVGNLTIVEVYEDATFSNFYHISTQVGKRRSTKRLVRVANRSEGIQPYYRAHLIQPGLDGLAEHWQKHPGVVSVKVRIIKKRAYCKLISARPDELGLTTSKVNLPLRSFSPLSSHLFNVVRHS
jgi:hypothetical protein